MEPGERKENFLGELLRFGLIAFLVVVPIRLFVAQPFVVSGASMEPTFSGGEYLIIDELSYRFREPARGDVVVFRFPLDPAKYFIKRIIGLPGETVKISGGRVTVASDALSEDVELVEPYAAGLLKGGGTLTVSLKKDEYFVLGDNRRESSDSRLWGPLPRGNIVGRAFVRLIPIAEAGYLPGKAIY